MTDKEEILVKRVGCLAQTLICLIRKYPHKNSRAVLAEKLGLSVKTVRNVANNMIELGVITEETTERQSLEWNKYFVVQPETEWKIQ